MPTQKIATFDLTKGDIDAAKFNNNFASRGIPCVVRECTRADAVSPWVKAANVKEFFSHPDLDAAEAEVLRHPEPFQLHGIQDCGDEPAPKALSRLLDADVPPEQRRERRTYVKIALTQCKNLMEHLQPYTFLNDDGHVYEAALHPALLRPGHFFCWAYVGDEGTGSPTHVDIMNSDAWLVVLEGKKEWIMVPPLDKHFVTRVNPETGAHEFADLFNPDLTKFPNFHKARLSRFYQEAGDAVFVPGDAPHAVINIEASRSLTYNFLRHSVRNMKWESMVEGMMSGKESSDEANQISTTVDLVIFNKAIERRVTLRAFCKSDAASFPGSIFADKFRSEESCRTLLDDFTVRMNLRAFHEHFGPYGRFLDKSKTAALPVGFDVSMVDRRVVLYFSMASGAHFVNLFNRPPFAMETWTPTAPNVTFHDVSSFFGRLPCFPPLSVILGQNQFFEESLSMVALHDSDKKVETSEADDVWLDSDSCIDEAGKSSSSSSPTDPPTTFWHYSRFPFKPMAVDQWCATYLFYCSHLINGPISLHPLTEDGTLATESPVGKPESTHELHFIPLRRNNGVDWERIGAYDLGNDVVKSLAMRYFMQSDYTEFGTTFLAAHGLTPVPPADRGIEKCMAAVLYFTATPRVVGFRYSHVFSCVNEPDTVCLSGPSASRLLTPEFDDDTSLRVRSRIMMKFCDAACRTGDGEDAAKSTVNQLVRELATEAALKDGKKTAISMIKRWCRVKYARVVGDKNEAAPRSPERLNPHIESAVANL